MIVRNRMSMQAAARQPRSPRRERQPIQVRLTVPLVSDPEAEDQLIRVLAEILRKPR